jgi:hypothetical protein
MSLPAIRWSLVVALFCVFLGGGCATQIRAGATTNPPPEVAFNQYSAFELRPLGIAPRFANQSGNEAARVKVQKELELRLKPVLAAWTKPGGNVLVIEPVIDEIKFIGGAARFWAGTLAGSSAVIVSVTYRDANTGNVVARPQFYQHASAWGGSFTFGVTDNLMLNRIAELVSQYTQANYARAVGGPTGADESRVAEPVPSAAN